MWLVRVQLGRSGIAWADVRPATAIVGFRYFEEGKTLEELNRVNQELMDLLNSDGRILVSSIVLNGVFTIRVIPFGQKTHFKHVKIFRDLVRQAVKSPKFVDAKAAGPTFSAS